MTSNLLFSKWEAIFKDAMMTAAAINRLVNHRVSIELNIPTYRVEHAKKRQQEETQGEAIWNGVTAKKRERWKCRGLWKEGKCQRQAFPSFHKPLVNLAKTGRKFYIPTAPNYLSNKPTTRRRNS